MQINPGLPLGYHWVLASASVIPVASQCTCSSSGLPVCSNYSNQHWIATGRPLGNGISQCCSSAVCPVVSQCTESVWFRGHWFRSLLIMQPLMYTTGMFRVVWAKLISFVLQLQIHKSYTGAHNQGMQRVILKYSYVWRAEIVCIGEQWTPSISCIYRDLSTCWLASVILSFPPGIDATLLNYMCLGVCGPLSPSSGVPV